MTREKEIDVRLHEIEEEIKDLYLNTKGPHDLEWYRKYVNPLDSEKEELEKEKFTIRLFNLQVGDGVHFWCWTDVWSATIIERKPKTLVIQKDIAKRIDNNGMSDSQEYEFIRDENGMTLTFRWSEKKKRWVNKSYRMGMGRSAYYDYSF